MQTCTQARTMPREKSNSAGYLRLPAGFLRTSVCDGQYGGQGRMSAHDTVPPTERRERRDEVMLLVELRISTPLAAVYMQPGLMQHRSGAFPIVRVLCHAARERPRLGGLA
eukprot:TRINITY_DN96723_c0_g1_i1.p2 TRINITY_DN96723_c0_g1~~TRINITY_DN96723_c0_g1_i1.p2  ORF type:complete len:111 (-),score=3.71 TRINITY_DN96723_c0_g1_i1:402-734(-)